MIIRSRKTQTLAEAPSLWHNRNMGRWILFFLTIVIGVAAGLVYAWFINPVRMEDNPISSLRIDYKADYVLMVAESYQVEQDLGLAVYRLSFLGDASPEESVLRAIQHGVSTNPAYTQADIGLLHDLSSSLHNRYRPPEADPP
jgi:hypothetical protein